jgi:hypothetical protein
MRHSLFVVRPESWQPIPMLVKGLSKGGHVPVAEDSENSSEERHDFISLRALKSRAQAGKVTHERLSGGQPHGPALGSCWSL